VPGLARPSRRLIVVGLLALAACEGVSHRDIGNEINVLVLRNDALVGPATERLVAYRRNAIPQIETAIHTAAPNGRLNLVAALDRIGDEEAVPVLRQVAVYDVTPEVRAAAEAALTRWATGQDHRGERARAGLAAVGRKRAVGMGPLIFGDGGMPGVPATIGAPGPLGGESKP
jgi:hypothetical protein